MFKKSSYNLKSAKCCALIYKTIEVERRRWKRPGRFAQLDHRESGT